METHWEEETREVPQREGKLSIRRHHEYRYIMYYNYYSGFKRDARPFWETVSFDLLFWILQFWIPVTLQKLKKQILS